MATEDKFIVAIELGSSKVTGIAGRKQPDGVTQILAFAQEPSTTFIRKGRINNVNKMTQCILNMKEKLEQQLQKSVSRVCSRMWMELPRNWLNSMPFVRIIRAMPFQRILSGSMNLRNPSHMMKRQIRCVPSGI